MENVLSGAWSVFHWACMPMMVWMAVSDPTGFFSGHIVGGYTDMFNTASNFVGGTTAAVPAIAPVAAAPAIPAGCHMMNGALMNNITMGPCLG